MRNMIPRNSDDSVHQRAAMQAAAVLLCSATAAANSGSARILDEEIGPAAGPNVVW